jgi:hypothetical protein
MFQVDPVLRKTIYDLDIFIFEDWVISDYRLGIQLLYIIISSLNVQKHEMIIWHFDCWV